MAKPKRDTRRQQRPRGTRWVEPPKDHPKRPKRDQVCVYCGIRPAVDREHVFARCLFDPVPDPPITVPSCVECNCLRGDGGSRDMNLDEEWFRNTLCMREAADLHPVGKKVLTGRVFRSLDNSPQLRQAVVRDMAMVWRQNAAGIIEPNIPTFKMNWERMRRVLRKIVKGLFYTYMKRRLPDSAIIRTNPHLNQDTFDILLSCVQQSSTLGPIELGNKTVIFAGGRTSPECDDTIWLVTFYQCHAVTMTTLSTETAKAWDWTDERQ